MANLYLLLRSNKQSGPYSVDELRKLPLQPYDLLWLEGKTGSWLHPGEIEEIKSFAPYPGNMQFNFNARKPGIIEERSISDTSPAIQLPKTGPTNTTRFSNNPIISSTKSTDAAGVNGSKNYEKVTYPEYPTKKVAHGYSDDWKKQMRWAIPVVILLMIGVWIGINWQYFPANEEVSVPLTDHTKREVKNLPNLAKVEVPKNATQEVDSPSLDSSRAITPGYLPGNEISANEVHHPSSENRDEFIRPEAEVKNPPAYSTEVPRNGTVSTYRETPAIKPVHINKQPSVEAIASEKSSVKSYRTNPETLRTLALPGSKHVINNPAAKVVRTNSAHDLAAKHPGAQTDRGLFKGTNPVTQYGKEKTTSEVKFPTHINVKKEERVFDSYLSKKQVPVDYLVNVDGNFQHTNKGKGVEAVDFTVYNRSGKTLKAVNVEVQYFGKNNEVLSMKVLKFSNISTDGAIKLDAPSHATAEKVGYKVLYVSSSLGDFFYEPVELLTSSASR